MLIDDYLELVSFHNTSPNECYTISKSWTQGRTVFGGLSTAILYQACQSHLEEKYYLRSITTNFVGPLMADTPFTIQVEEIRSGKNVSQYQARAIQDNKIAVVCQMCFAVDRSSKIKVEPTLNHNMPLPQKASFIPHIPKITPKFLKHFDLNIQEGGIPYTGKKTSKYHGWMRYKKPIKRFSIAHIIAIIDAWPPTLIQMMKWPAPASTVSWNLEFVHPLAKVNTNDWLAYQCETLNACSGYGQTQASIFNTSNQVLAFSRQTVAVFD